MVTIKEMHEQLTVDADYCIMAYNISAAASSKAETIGFRSDRMKLAIAARDAVGAYAAFLDRSGENLTK